MTRPERTPASSPRKKNLLGIFLYIKLSFKFLQPLEQTPKQVSEIKFLVLLWVLNVQKEKTLHKITQKSVKFRMKRR